MRAIDLYRTHFRPSARLVRPYVMLGISVIAAESDEEARFLATSTQQTFVNLRSGRPWRLPPPKADYLDQLGPQEKAMLDSVLSCSAIGSPLTVTRQLQAFTARRGADELMITSQSFDHAKRLRSYEISAGIHPALS